MYTDKLFFLLLTSLIVMGCSSPKNKSIQVMTWNIWHGGLHGTKADGFKKDTANTVNVYKVLQQEKADVLLMQKPIAVGWKLLNKLDTPFDTSKFQFIHTQ